MSKYCISLIFSLIFFSNWLNLPKTPPTAEIRLWLNFILRNYKIFYIEALLNENKNNFFFLTLMILSLVYLIFSCFCCCYYYYYCCCHVQPPPTVPTKKNQHWDWRRGWIRVFSVFVSIPLVKLLWLQKLQRFYSIEIESLR